MLMEQMFVVTIIDNLVGLIVSVDARSRLRTFPFVWSRDTWSVAPFVLSDAHGHASNGHTDPSTDGLVATIPSLSVNHEVCQRYRLRNYQGAAVDFRVFSCVSSWRRRSHLQTRSELSECPPVRKLISRLNRR